MENQPGREQDQLQETRAKVVEAALPHVVFDGWSRKTLEAAVADSDADAALAHLAFPRGGVDLALEFQRLNDARLVEELAADPALGQMKVREKVAYAVRRRLELVAEHREAVRRAVTLLSLPVHAPEGARGIWRTADSIWTAVGDTSTDYNWYTKRALLSSVYSATVLYWLGDDTPGHSGTWGFLDRRIDDVMRFEKARSFVTDNPVARAAMWGPSRLFGALTGRREGRASAIRTPPAPRTPPPAPGRSRSEAAESAAPPMPES